MGLFYVKKQDGASKKAPGHRSAFGTASDRPHGKSSLADAGKGRILWYKGRRSACTGTKDKGKERKNSGSQWGYPCG